MNSTTALFNHFKTETNQPQAAAALTAAAVSYPFIDALLFDDAPGAAKLCDRLNTVSANLDVMDTSDRARLCEDFIGAFHGLEDILILEEKRLSALKILLAVINCHDTESIKYFGAKLNNSGDEEASSHLQNQAKKDDDFMVHAPTDNNPQELKSFSTFQQALLKSYVSIEILGDLSMAEDNTEKLFYTLIQAKMQIGSGSGLGNWGEPVKYESLNHDMVTHIASLLVHPRHTENAEKLQHPYDQIQQQFSDPDSALVKILINSPVLTQSLDEEEMTQFIFDLTTPQATRSGKYRATMSNESAMLFMLAARDSALKEEFTRMGITPRDVNWLAKAHSVLNFADAHNKSELTNSDIGQALSESNKFTRAFFESPLFSEQKKENPETSKVAIAARWVIETMQLPRSLELPDRS